ncbi:MAG TPA: cysteine desulfurase [Bacteroidales bacterium]|jgi:cysteine desulfurase/selenocysteine lyase|nr:cysteine desulfurase [Bacteroidales bacterium]
MIDIEAIRNDFPILHQKSYHRTIVYLDNAATTQKPNQVIDITSEFYSKYNSNIHRGVHFLSEKMTEAYENARNSVKKFINAKHSHEIIFTSGTTESINLLAFSFGEAFINAGDEIIVSESEHHSNIVPWQMLCERKKAVLKVLPLKFSGEWNLVALNSLVNEKTKLIAVSHISNSLGTINPIEEIINYAHARNIPVMIDGAQGIQHQMVDVQALDCDFYVFSGHKIYGPTGIGILYGKESWLEKLPPYKGGGDMIKTVTFEKTIYNDLPFKFEAGTTNFIGAVGLATALKYLDEKGRQDLLNYEDELYRYALTKIQSVEGIRLIGTAEKRASIISFLLGKIHPFDCGMMLDKMDIAVRTGNHCTQPLMKFFGIDGTVRASFSFYNTKEEVDYLIESLEKVKKLFA